MCGFVGIVNHSNSEIKKHILQSMTDKISHRGPDDEGIYIDKNVGLGFRRLSIIDLSKAGHQPMACENNRYIIVFNGEIYNYIELKQELVSLGYAFTSNSDTEVLLKAYICWGVACLNKLNGMWGFLIYDKQEGIVFGARDRFGIKPLFLYQNNTSFLVSSEIKSITASGLYRGDIDWEVSANFMLRNQLDDGKKSFYKGIEYLKPGHYFVKHLDGNIEIKQYWSLPTRPNGQIKDENEAIEEYRYLFEDSVRLRLRSDVPVGVFLSGGLDSTSIICKINELKLANSSCTNKSTTAFSYISKQFDESSYIRDTLQQINANFHQIKIDPSSLWETLPQVLSIHDEPVHSMTALIGYNLYSQASNSGIKVVLNGQGADETAAGYFVYFKKYWEELLHRGNFLECSNEISKFVAEYGGNKNKELTKTFKRLIYRILRKNQQYKNMKEMSAYKEAKKNSWFTSDFMNSLPSYTNSSQDTDLAEYLKRSVTVSPLPQYLRIEDRNSMAHSVEARLPFLDYRLVELLFRIDPISKLSGKWNKQLMRQAMKGLIPASVLHRKDKMGFPSDADKWIAKSWDEPIREILQDIKTRERGIYNVDKILLDMDAHRDGITRIGDKLFRLIEFELWLRLTENRTL